MSEDEARRVGVLSMKTYHFPAGTAVFGILLEVEARGSARPRAGESIYDFDAAFIARAESPGAWGAALGNGDHRLQEADNGD